MGGVVSGALLEQFWWGSIFLINVVVVVVALVAGFFLIPRSREKIHAPLDPLGAVLSIAGLSALVYGIIEAPDHGWGSTQTLVTFADRARGARRVRARGSCARRSRCSTSATSATPASPRRPRRSPSCSSPCSARTSSSPSTCSSCTATRRCRPGVRILPWALAYLISATQSAKLVERFGQRLVVASGLTIAGIGIAMLAAHERRDRQLLVVRARRRGAGARHGHHDRAVDRGHHAVAAAAQGGGRLGGERHHPRARRRARASRCWAASWRRSSAARCQGAVERSAGEGVALARRRAAVRGHARRARGPPRSCTSRGRAFVDAFTSTLWVAAIVVVVASGDRRVAAARRRRRRRPTRWSRPRRHASRSSVRHDARVEHGVEHLAGPARSELDLVEVLQALGDPVRLQIVRVLAAADAPIACHEIPIPVRQVDRIAPPQGAARGRGSSARRSTAPASTTRCAAPTSTPGSPDCSTAC